MDDMADYREEKTSKKIFTFYPAKDAEGLKDNIRCLVMDKDGFIDLAIWLNGKWYDEGSMIYDGGENITDKVEQFAIIS